MGLIRGAEKGKLWKQEAEKEQNLLSSWELSKHVDSVNKRGFSVSKLKL